jgi:hypothetical protein
LLPAEEVVTALRASDQLWETGPGLVGLRGRALGLLQALEASITELARSGAEEEWRVPPAVSLATLARSGYFASFPQWLTVASHLTSNPQALERVAAAAEPAAEVGQALAPPGGALAPAVCYHAYAGLAGKTFARAHRVTMQATCWRHEGDRLQPLERGWAFTMREVVCVGPADAVVRFLEEAQAWVTGLARRLGLSFQIEEASDPFFAPTSRGRALLQRAKGLKRELMLPIGPGRSLAVASLNDHELYFGNAFELRLPDGEPASSACVAFGLERWLLAFLVEHGVDAKAWPTVSASSEERR